MKNYGLLYIDKPEDLLGGSIPYETRNTTGDWRQFIGREERQNFKYFDSMACVSFSALNILEAQANWILSNNLWPAQSLKFWQDNGYIVAGKFEFSDRFIAKMSGTTPQGNYFQHVWDAVRKYGLVPESKWRWKEDSGWDENYSEPDEIVKELGRESLRHFTLFYEKFVPVIKELEKQLKHAPIHVGLATCQPWSNRVLACGSQANHAVMLYDVESVNNSFNIFDHYEPYYKKLLPGYKIWYAYKAIFSPIGESPLDKDALLQDIEFGDSGGQVTKLRKVLNRLGWKNDGLDQYDEKLAEVVLKFQKANLNRLSWAYWWAVFYHKGGKVDLYTREVINNALKHRA